MKMRPVTSLLIALIALTLPAIGANASAAFEASSFDEHVGTPRNRTFVNQASILLSFLNLSTQIVGLKFTHSWTSKLT